jgi:hypothetical protein
MIAPLAKFLDWSGIQISSLMMSANDLNSKREEAIQFLKGPDFIPAESQPAQLKFNGDFHFTFPTPRPCEFAENNVVHGRLFRCAGRWQERPVIILLPGWNDSSAYKIRFPLITRRGNRAGFNVVTLVPPYHFQRVPRQRREFDRGRLPSIRGRSGARYRRNSRPDRMAVGGRLSGCGVVGLFGGSMACGNDGVLRCTTRRDRFCQPPRSHRTVSGTTSHLASHSREPSQDSRPMRRVESHADEFNYNPTGPLREKYFID